jgi:arylsulfatase A-like enzyme
LCFYAAVLPFQPFRKDTIRLIPPGALNKLLTEGNLTFISKLLVMLYKILPYWLSIFGILIISPAYTQKKQSKPNIIYIMTDDMGFADLSCYGRKDYQTPHLDRLASEGVMFTNAYAAAPVCTPTRVAFMSGQYPARNEVGLHEPLEWSTKDSLLGLAASKTSVAALMKQAGYETFLVGKWHLGVKPAFTPRANGFDYFYGFLGPAFDYISHTDPKGNPDFYENEKPIKKEGYATDLWKEKANEIISQRHDKPFFLTIMFNAPHWPWQGPTDKKYPDTLSWVRGGSPQIYAAMMKSLDDAVGSIMKTLEEKNLADNTIVIFTSDNGGERYSDNGIFKGKKMELWEGGIREPAFIRWPGHIPAGSKTDQVAITMDWTASILAAGGVKINAKTSLDGINLLPVVSGQSALIDRTLYWRISQRRQHKAMREGNWKYLLNEKGEEFLFDLANDPSEKINLMNQHISEFEKLKQKYAKWESTMLPPLAFTGDNLR